MIIGSSCVRTFCPRVLRTAGLLIFTLRRRRLTTACSVSATKNKEKEKVIVESGPTGSRKTRLALELAKRLNGEIISIDSVQVFRGLDIGSTKPSPAERQAGAFQSLRIFFRAKKKYFAVLVKTDAPKASLEIASEVYSDLEDLQKNDDWNAAVELVVKEGDSKAQLLAANDCYRLRRSLEIIKSSGSPPSAFQVPYDSFQKQCDANDASPSTDVVEEVKSKELDYDFIYLFLSIKRVDLYKSIDYRCEDMRSGNDDILSEANWLLDSGLLPNSNSATRAIGYRQETVLDFIYDAYHDNTENLVVRESLRMKKELTSHREVAELKAYRPKNRHFIRHEDCSDILDWIRKTQWSNNKSELDHSLH